MESDLDWFIACWAFFSAVWLLITFAIDRDGRNL